VHYGSDGFLLPNALNPMLWGVDVMFGEGWLPYQPSQDLGDLSTQVFDLSLVFVIPCHILRNV
jgi:hypothetical protein